MAQFSHCGILFMPHLKSQILRLISPIESEAGKKTRFCAVCTIETFPEWPLFFAALFLYSF